MYAFRTLYFSQSYNFIHRGSWCDISNIVIVIENNIIMDIIINIIDIIIDTIIVINIIMDVIVVMAKAPRLDFNDGIGSS